MRSPVGTIAVLGEYRATNETHVATDAAIRHSSDALGVSVDAEWVSTALIDDSLFADHDGIWVAPGSPYEDMNKTLAAIRHARERAVPALGTCGGFQHMVIEYARNALGFADAQHAESDPHASNLFVSALTCSLVGREMTLDFVPGSRVAKIYGARTATESYYCNFGVNPQKVKLLKSGALRVTGSDQEGEVRVIELPDHPFFIGTLFVPQTRSRAGQPHPLVTAFVASVAARREGLRPSNGYQNAAARADSSLIAASGTSTPRPAK
jgi:CTP synthase (UTP-ammonia lyase)